eukprot:GHVR01095882.1.p1 GENE.GHVR01095882.1~~GHVR01095882.1.p1  ORF type:complete len:396 (+),score=13.62 GHVR01095882.1:44-1231(+)
MNFESNTSNTESSWFSGLLEAIGNGIVFCSCVTRKNVAPGKSLPGLTTEMHDDNTVLEGEQTKSESSGQPLRFPMKSEASGLSSPHGDKLIMVKESSSSDSESQSIRKRQTGLLVSSPGAHCSSPQDKKKPKDSDRKDSTLSTTYASNQRGNMLPRALVNESLLLGSDRAASSGSYSEEPAFPQGVGLPNGFSANRLDLRIDSEGETARDAESALSPKSYSLMSPQSNRLGCLSPPRFEDELTPDASGRRRKKRAADTPFAFGNSMSLKEARFQKAKDIGAKLHGYLEKSKGGNFIQLLAQKKIYYFVEAGEYLSSCANKKEWQEYCKSGARPPSYSRMHFSEIQQVSEDSKSDRHFTVHVNDSTKNGIWHLGCESEGERADWVRNLQEIMSLLV